MKSLLEDKHTNPGILGEPIPLDRIATPALLVDEARLTRNLEGMARLAESAGVALRPHVKTHKSPDLARRQTARGAQGLCTATVREATVFAGHGFRDILVAYPILGVAAETLARLGADTEGLDLACTADSERGLDDLSRAALRAGVTLGVWIEVDTGLRRCGVPPGDPRLDALAKRARSLHGLRLRGLLTHAGHAYAADPKDVPSIGRSEGEQMVEAATRLDRAGLGPLRVGLGSTPTVYHAARVAGVGEIHAGVYVFGDRQQARLRAMRLDDVALTVLTTVVSGPGAGRRVVDAGSKTLSADRGAHGTEGVTGFGCLRALEDHVAPTGPIPFQTPAAADDSALAGPVLARLSEEHGMVEDPGADRFAPGDRVEVLPNHACAAVNLARTLYVTRGEGRDREVVAAWPVAARGGI